MSITHPEKLRELVPVFIPVGDAFVKNEVDPSNLMDFV
jgi:hypothetical protein